MRHELAKELAGWITTDGFLSIFRGDDDWCDQLCPFAPRTVDGEMMNCGSWCPHFGEPQKSPHGHQTTIALCHGKVLTFDVLDDDRGKSEQEQTCGGEAYLLPPDAEVRKP